MSTWFSNMFGGGREDKDYTPPKFESKYEPPNKDEKKKEVTSNKFTTPPSTGVPSVVLPSKTTPHLKPTQQPEEEEEEEDDMFSEMEVKTIEKEPSPEGGRSYVPPVTSTTSLSSPTATQTPFQEEKPTSPISETITKKNSSSSLKE
jgi:hypothetical protein